MLIGIDTRSQTDITVRVISSADGLGLPTYQTAGAAGMDLCAGHNMIIEPGRRELISTGLKLVIPAGHKSARDRAWR